MLCCPYVDQDVDDAISKFIKAKLDRYRGKHPGNTLVGPMGKLRDVKIWWCAPGTMVYPAVKVLD